MGSWETVRRRYRLLDGFAQDFARSGQQAVTEWQSAIEAEYGDFGDLLRDVQRRYLTAAEARLDAVLEASPEHAEASVIAALAEVSRSYPQFAHVLEEHSGHPALAKGTARFRHSVLIATGTDPAAHLPGGSFHDEKEEEDDRKHACSAAVRPVRSWVR